MFVRSFLVSILSLCICFEASAAQLSSKDSSTRKETPYSKIVNKEGCLKTEGGFLTLYKNGQKLYAELPLDYLDRDFLAAATISGISDGDLGTIGYKNQDPQMLRFSSIDSLVFLCTSTDKPRFDKDDSALAQAVDLTSLNPIVQKFTRVGLNPDSTAILFEITPMFMKPIDALAPLKNTSSGGIVLKAAYDEKRSVMGTIKAFEDNVSIKTTMTYTVNTSVLGLLTLKKDQPVTLNATWTLLLLPQTPTRIRYADSRIGIFLSSATELSSETDWSRTFSFIHRWNLCPSDSAAFRRGEIVRPVKPIVFYLDPAFPSAWREAAREGILRWRAAFEAIGFKDALQVLDYPEDENFDPDNLKYSCIRYVPSATANAMGPSWVDPRSGEIINASVIVYSDIVKLLNNWRFCQTAQIDPRVRSPKLPDDIMQESIAYVLAHEVGHCLGFMHNMSASASYVTDSLRSASFTQKYGTTPSIMDYARFNYIAQKEDSGVKLCPPDLGIYDYYLVRYAYQPFLDAESSEEEKPFLEELVNSHTSDKRFRYGRQQISYRYDPSAIEEDLGDNPIVAGNYGIRNLQYILSQLNTWFPDSVDTDASIRAMAYDNIVAQYNRYIQAVMLNIGGIYLSSTSASDSESKAIAVSKSLQKESLFWILDQIRSCGWLDDSELCSKFAIRTPRSGVIALNTMLSLLKTQANVVLSSSLADENEGYTPEEWMEDMSRSVWESKSGKLSATERMMQRQFVVFCTKAAEKEESSLSASLRTAGDMAFRPSLQEMVLYGMDPGGVMEKNFETLQAIENEKGPGYIASLIEDSCWETAFGPAGYGWQGKVNIKTIDETRSLAMAHIYDLQKKLEKLSRRGTDRAHYLSLLYSINQSLKQK